MQTIIGLANNKGGLLERNPPFFAGTLDYALGQPALLLISSASAFYL
jgi:hypothetical protein